MENIKTKKLCCEDLMVGDWVMWKEKPVQVARASGLVYSFGHIPITLAHCNNKGLLESHDIKSISPIPITAEILEKNGFKKIQIHGEKQDDIFQCYDDEIIIEVGIYDPNFILIHYRYETPDGIYNGELSSIVKVDGGKFYLHELQHVLRLCGINKTIEL